MSVIHLDHPSQATACGARATVVGHAAIVFDAAAEEDRCGRCARVRRAQQAGRKTHRGEEVFGLEAEQQLAALVRRLTAAQLRILLELAEPNSNEDGTWYFPHKNLRTLRSLTELTLAEHVESDVWKVGYRLTTLGRTLATSDLVR